MPDDPLAVSADEKILTLVCGDYERTRPLLDGTVGVAGYQLKGYTLPPQEMFRRAFEVPSSMSVSCRQASTSCTWAVACPYVGIPSSRRVRFAARDLCVRGQSDQ